jgi:hypothetical protein
MAVKKRLFGSVLFASALVAMLGTLPAEAGVRVYVGVAPPPVIVEKVPVAPSPGHVWIPGYHRWDGRAYVWVPGRYAVAPRPHALWVPGHWVKHRRGWYWVGGRWRR